MSLWRIKNGSLRQQFSLKMTFHIKWIAEELVSKGKKMNNLWGQVLIPEYTITKRLKYDGKHCRMLHDQLSVFSFSWQHLLRAYYESNNGKPALWLKTKQNKKKPDQQNLNQVFSHISRHENYMKHEGPLKHRLLGSTPDVFALVCLDEHIRVYISFFLNFNSS